MINELKKLIIDRLKVIHNESLLALANHPSIIDVKPLDFLSTVLDGDVAHCKACQDIC